MPISLRLIWQLHYTMVRKYTLLVSAKNRPHMSEECLDPVPAALLPLVSSSISILQALTKCARASISAAQQHKALLITACNTVRLLLSINCNRPSASQYMTRSKILLQYKFGYQSMSICNYSNDET